MPVCNLFKGDGVALDEVETDDDVEELEVAGGSKLPKLATPAELAGLIRLLGKGGGGMLKR